MCIRDRFVTSYEYERAKLLTSQLPAAAEAVKGSEAGSYLLSFTIPKGDAGPEGQVL